MILDQRNERSTALESRCPQVGVQVGVAHDRPNRSVSVLTELQEGLHGLGAQSTCGNIGYPQQADVIVRVDQNLEKSQDILDLSTIEVTLAAYKSIGDFRLPQGRFQWSGLKIGAKENGLVIPGIRLLSRWTSIPSATA